VKRDEDNISLPLGEGGPPPVDEVLFSVKPMQEVRLKIYEDLIRHSPRLVPPSPRGRLWEVRLFALRLGQNLISAFPLG